MKMQKMGAAAALCLMAVAAGSVPAQAQTATAPMRANNVVLVHGAWADGSSWSEVIPLLQAAGLHVTAVQNPLTTLEESDRKSVV